MLVVMYVISIVSSVFVYVFEELERFKHRAISLVISILTGIAFCVPMFNIIMQNFPNVHFWPIFAVLSLILWQFAFISGEVANALDYIGVAALLSATLWLLCPTLYPTNNWQKCNIEHIETEIVPIVTTINGENVYGDGYIIRCVNDISSNKIIYHYYKFENGIPLEAEFPAKSTAIHYITNDEAPYLKITTTMNCSGYNPDFDKHIFMSYDKVYHLYVPEGSILNVLQ